MLSVTDYFLLGITGVVSSCSIYILKRYRNIITERQIEYQIPLVQMTDPIISQPDKPESDEPESDEVILSGSSYILVSAY